MTKLDLGAGGQSPDGYLQMGNAHGSQIFPLAAFADESVDAIRASHVLEHFPHGQIADVLREWVRVLKPGGELKIAVPNFEWIAENYVAGQPINTQGYLMGGQIDSADFHKSTFDRASLTRHLAAAGLMLVREWKSEIQDCAALPVSLNLSATKPHKPTISVCAAMSVPRLGFMDMFFCAFEALPQLGIKLSRFTGAYWEQCIERTIDGILLDEKPDAVLTLDYDTVFSRRDASMLLQLMCCHPEADAIAAIQSGRGGDKPLFTVKAQPGQNLDESAAHLFAPDLTKVSTAHFGLTLLRAEGLQRMPKPWFWSQPAPDGSWGPGKVDADIWFWRKWEAVGNSLYVANRSPVGHLDLVVDWPSEDLTTHRQPIHQWRDNGKPKEAWS